MVCLISKLTLFIFGCRLCIFISLYLQYVTQHLRRQVSNTYWLKAGCLRISVDPGVFKFPMINFSFSPLLSKRPHRHLADVKDSLLFPVIFVNQLKGLMKPPWTVISVFVHSKCFGELPYFWSEFPYLFLVFILAFASLYIMLVSWEYTSFQNFIFRTISFFPILPS